MRETPRSQGTAGDARVELPQHFPGRAFAHNTPGASGSGNPQRSDGGTPHTPRGARPSGPTDCPGATPPAPGQSAFLVTVLTSALLFALLTWQVVVRGPLLAADERLDQSFIGRGPRQLTEFCADLGNVQVALPVLAVTLVYALWRGHRLLVLAAALAVAAVPAVVVPLKALVDRPSPLDPAATGYFPSGHAATAAVAYCGAALLLAVCVRGRWPMPVALVLTAATGTGLVLRGYHWPLDVLGSWCLSVLLLAPAWWLSRRAASGSPPRASRAPGAPGR
ncbi:phosphatase PAP2 family protein [Streptomyces sp. NPDC054863]